MSGAGALRQLRSMDLGYSTQLFYSDYHKITSSLKLLERLPELDKRRTIPNQLIPETKWTPPGNYKYTIKVTGIDNLTGEETEQFMSFYSNRKRTLYGAASEASSILGTEEYEITSHSLEYEVVEVFHKEGEVW